MKVQGHVIDFIDAYLDGELPGSQRRMVRAHLKACESCRDIWQEKTALSEQVKLLPAQECPARVVAEVMRRTQPEARGRKVQFGVTLLRKPAHTWRFAAVLATAATVTLFLVLWPGERQAPPPPEIYTEEDVEKAKVDVERALYYLNSALARTQRTIEEDVMPEQVVKPLKAGLQSLFGSHKNGG